MWTVEYASVAASRRHGIDAAGYACRTPDAKANAEAECLDRNDEEVRNHEDPVRLDTTQV